MSNGAIQERFEVMGEGYANLASLADIGLLDIEPFSQEAKDELQRYAVRLQAKYEATTGAPSEYAVGFTGCKPAFEGEKAAWGGFIARVVRAWPYTEENPFETFGCGFWLEPDRKLLQYRRMESMEVAKDA